MRPRPSNSPQWSTSFPAIVALLFGTGALVLALWLTYHTRPLAEA